MKRSQINELIRWAKALLKEHHISLPQLAHWGMDEWKQRKDQIDVIKKVMLGWDITDFGTGRFDEIGAVLYTVRNGSLNDPGCGVPYCEKYILMNEGQRLPKHYHVWKTEDIINRAGGVLQVFLWNADKDGHELDTDVHVFIDGVETVVPAGGCVEILPGNSISLTPYIAHIFGPKIGTGALAVGEVSKVNDDNTDNYFLEPTSRFADIIEDEPAMHPLCNEYDKLI